MHQHQHQHSSHGPKFGDWDDNNIPYTTFFENARKEHGTATVRFNPNDPEDDNLDAFMLGTRGSEIHGSDNRSSSLAKSRIDQSRSDYPRGQRRSRVSVHTRQPSAIQTSNESQHKRVTSIPKFGAWDESDPRSGEGFTVIFNRVKEEKQFASSTFPAALPPHPNSSHNRERKAKSCSSMICCRLFAK